MRRLAHDLANVVREVDPIACQIDPEIWNRASAALKQIDLGRGIGGYQHPIPARTP
jgi:hypothetical protein